MNKEAQFFLLAAVIISVIVISLGVTTNRAVVQQEPKSFYDFTYDVDREVGEVFNYEIYKNIQGGNVSDFVSLMAKEIRDNDPDSGFVFVFGNNKHLNLSNYDDQPVEVALGDTEDVPRGVDVYYKYYAFGSWSNHDANPDICYQHTDCQMCYVDGTDTEVCYSTYAVSGANEAADGQICTLSGCTTLDGTQSDYDSSAGTLQIVGSLEEEDSVTVVIDGARLKIPVSNYSQVYFITKKTAGNESFISVS